jgi:predicted RNA binding protein YcfA (HicA-like mRNA interferase family)
LPRLRRLSGDDVIAILSEFGFEVAGRRGSHVKLRRSAPGGGAQTLVVPAHRELRMGTCRAIYRQACAFVDEALLKPHFFAD